MSTISKNTVANYTSLIYTTLITVVMLSQYMQFLGEEAYGLVGFFSLMQTWLGLMTAGVGPTLSRQVAEYSGRKELWGISFKRMLRSIEIIVSILAIATALIVYLSRNWIASEWLDAKNISSETIAYSLTLMGIITALRWNITLYTSGIAGMERQVWLAGFNSVMTSIRYGAAYLQLRFLSSNIEEFFNLQLALTALELFVALKVFYNTQSNYNKIPDPGLIYSQAEIKKIGPFLLSIGYTSAIWTILTQTDKLILSHALPLKEFGYLTIVTLIANGILRFSEPITQAILPRMTFYYAVGDIKNAITLYKNSTQIIAVISFSIVGIVILFAEPIIYLLTNKPDAAKWGSDILMWFVIGNGILVVAGMQYALQFSFGNLRLHVINSTLNTFLQVPLMAYAAFEHGALAVAISWAIFRLTLFIIYPLLVHSRLTPGIHRDWLMKDVGMPLLGTSLGLVSITILSPSILSDYYSQSNLRIFTTLVLNTIIIFLFSITFSPVARKKLTSKLFTQRK